MDFQRYVLYGLGIHSEIPLWGEGEAECAADVTVRWRRKEYVGAAGSHYNSTAVDGGDEIRLSWTDICEMSVRRGTEILVETGEESEVTHLRHLVSGIGLGLALYQRGVFVLHASAVAIDGRAVVFAGPKWAGKSTLAAALTARGHALLSDDVVALDLAGDGPPLVRQGPCNLNLWPDSAAATGHEPSALHRIWSGSPKLVGWLTSMQQSVPVPLHAIFILSRSQGSPRLGEQLSSIDAFAQLVSHTHAFRWIDKAQKLAEHLQQCREVLQKVPLFRAERGESLESLEVLVRHIEECITFAGTCVGDDAGSPENVLASG